MIFRYLFSLLFLSFVLSGTVRAQDAAAPAPHEEKKGFDAIKVIFGHVADSHEWHFFELNGKPVAFPLPVIVYQQDKGLQVFSSAHFEEWTPLDEKTMKSNSYNGFHLERSMKEKLIADDGSKLYDLSVTKSILSMLIAAILLLWLMTSIAKKYKKNGHMKAPSGMQNAMEVIIIFMRDEVAKPNLGHKYARYMPLILTTFFFIWINNLFGLLPGGANLTGNIAVTLCLAVVFFIVMLVNSKKHFWSHLLNPPGLPIWVKCILVPIEIMSLFIKPIALTIRLFANMLAGHIVILSVISMIFIFGGLSRIVGGSFVVVSLSFSIFMFMLELLVGAIQAFIFANLVAVFIGQAIEEPSHSHHHIEEEIQNEEVVLA